MKKTIVLFIVALSATLLFAQPHPVYIEVWDIDWVQIPAGDVYYTVVILERPSEVVEINTYGWEYGGVIPGYLSGSLGNGFSTWAPGETLEITLTQISIGASITNSWTISSAGYEYYPNPGGLVIQGWPENFINWDNGVVGTVNIGTPHSPGIGNGTGMPNEDLLPIPEYVGYYFTLYTNENSPFDLTICLDHTAMQYIPFNLAYWNNEVWNFVPDEEMQILWTNPGTTNSCISFTIIPEGRTSIPIVFSGEAIQGEGLPVVITNFEAVNHQDDYVIVNWTTLFETEMSYYRVHRDGIEVHQSEALNQGSEHTYTFTDTPDFTGILSYTLEAVANDGTNGFWGLVEVVFGTGVSEVIESLESSRLDKNYPNPFNPTTTISFSVKENETGILTIFNAKGQVVTNETFYSGTHSYNWNAGKFSSGIYFYKLLTESFSEVKKMMLIK